MCDYVGQNVLKCNFMHVHFALFSFGSKSLSVGPLCTVPMSVVFSFAGSWNNLTLPFDLGTSTKLLHHSTVSSMPSGVMMSCFCSNFNSS